MSPTGAEINGTRGDTDLAGAVELFGVGRNKPDRYDLNDVRALETSPPPIHRKAKQPTSGGSSRRQKPMKVAGKTALPGPSEGSDLSSAPRVLIIFRSTRPTSEWRTFVATLLIFEKINDSTCTPGWLTYRSEPGGIARVRRGKGI
jgi:hypothetical protein